MKVTLSALLVCAIGGGAAYAQTQRDNSDFSTMQESGPPVAGGNGATAGPNWKNQAILPMPGGETREAPRSPVSEAPTGVTTPGKKSPPARQ